MPKAAEQSQRKLETSQVQMSQLLVCMAAQQQNHMAADCTKSAIVQRAAAAQCCIREWAEGTATSWASLEPRRYLEACSCRMLKNTALFPVEKQH